MMLPLVETRVLGHFQPAISPREMVPPVPPYDPCQVLLRPSISTELRTAYATLLTRVSSANPEGLPSTLFHVFCS